MTYIDWIISLVLAFIMGAVGLSLTLKSFKELASRPTAVLVGMGLQLVLLPTIAFGVAYAWQLPPAFQVGIIILAATPGGMTSNFISYLFHANTALAVSLTICNSLVTILTVPFLVNLGLDIFYPDISLYQLPFWPTAGRIFTIVLIPVLLGISFRAWKPKTAARLQLGFRWISMFLLAIVFLIKAFAPANAGGSEISTAEILLILPASLAVNVLALGLGRLVGYSLGYNRNDQLTMGVEIGIQNTSLAFLIAGTVLGNQDMLKPALIYATFSFLTAVLYGLWIKPEQWEGLKREFRVLRQRLSRK
jgi:BASS family bile acid:Na+ symporter